MVGSLCGVFVIVYRNYQANLSIAFDYYVGCTEKYRFL